MTSHNTASRPSSGHFDLTTQYKLIRSLPPNPAKWIPHGTTLLPSTPPIQEFLYNTPPTRGADSHVQISHIQTPPPTQQQEAQLTSALSTFSRYLQQSIHTTPAMIAEVQVAYGRKVRYDHVLGRVRAVWDYALKGAQTQRERREAGLYNRPTGTATVRDRAPGKKNRPKVRDGDGDGDGDENKMLQQPGKGESKALLEGGTTLGRRSTTSAATAVGQVERVGERSDESNGWQHGDVEDVAGDDQTGTERQEQGRIHGQRREQGEVTQVEAMQDDLESELLQRMHAVNGGHGMFFGQMAGAERDDAELRNMGGREAKRMKLEGQHGFAPGPSMNGADESGSEYFEDSD